MIRPTHAAWAVLLVIACSSSNESGSAGGGSGGAGVAAGGGGAPGADGAVAGEAAGAAPGGGAGAQVGGSEAGTAAGGGSGGVLVDASRDVRDVLDGDARAFDAEGGTGGADAAKSSDAAMLTAWTFDDRPGPFDARAVTPPTLAADVIFSS